MNKTNIEWARNPDGSQGYTWNPITGCLNHINGMCKGGGFPCYAHRLATTRLRERYMANGSVSNISPEGYSTAMIDPFYPRFWLERLEEPIKGYHYQEYGGANASASDKGIFVCDMSDLFGIGVPEEWTRQVLAVIKKCYYHRFYLLTKQPQNLIKYSPFPENCWVGVTVTNLDMARAACMAFAEIEATVKYVSFEPLLNPVPCKHLAGLSDWFIIGSQTRPSVYPQVEAVRDIAKTADEAGVPVFLKNNTANLFTHQDTRWAYTQDEDIPEMLSIRQEMPEVK